MYPLYVPLTRTQHPTLKGTGILVLKINPDYHFSPRCAEQAQHWFWNSLKIKYPQQANPVPRNSVVCAPEKYVKTVVNFQRNLSIHPVVLPQYNYQKITVPIIRLLNTWQEIFLRIYFDLWSVDSVKKNGGARSREYTCGGSRGLTVWICIEKIIFGKRKKKNWFISIISWYIELWVQWASCCREAK